MKAIIAYADKETHEAARRAAFDQRKSLSAWTLDAVKKALPKQISKSRLTRAAKAVEHRT